MARELGAELTHQIHVAGTDFGALQIYSFGAHYAQHQTAFLLELEAGNDARNLVINRIPVRT
jgi:hypothetical protein